MGLFNNGVIAKPNTGDRIALQAWNHYVSYFGREDEQDFLDRYEGVWSSRESFAKKLWAKSGKIDTLITLGVYPQMINWEIVWNQLKHEYLAIEFRPQDCHYPFQLTPYVYIFCKS